MWEIGMAAVNAYIVYSCMYDSEPKKNQGGVGEKFTHLKFKERLALNLIWPDKNVQSQDTILVIPVLLGTKPPPEPTGSLNSTNNAHYEDKKRTDEL